MTDDHTPSSEALVQRAASLVPLLRRNAVEAERLGRLPDENVRALDEQDLLRVARPRHRGGYGADAATLAAVLTEVASGCPATAWVMMIYNSVAYLAELLPDATLEEIYADPSPRIAGAFGTTGAVVERTDGGYRVRGGGRWPFNSGCHHAKWDLLRVAIEEPDGSATGAFVAFPIAELTIEDDWRVMGAEGTGSNSVSCGPVFVPEHRLGVIKGSAVAAIPPDVITAQNCAIPLGMARHALEAFLAMAKASRIGSLGYEHLSDSPVVHVAVATAAVKLKLIEAYQRWTLSPDRDGADPLLLQAAGGGCLRLAREAIEALYDACPSSELHADRPLQRLLRDAHAFGHHHGFSQFSSFELYGRKLCQN